MEQFILITFKNTHDAMKAEKCINEKIEALRLIPIPSEISAGCGLSLKMDAEYLHEAKIELAKAELSFSNIYEVKKTGLKKEIKQIE